MAHGRHSPQELTLHSSYVLIDLSLRLLALLPSLLPLLLPLLLRTHHCPPVHPSLQTSLHHLD